MLSFEAIIADATGRINCEHPKRECNFGLDRTWRLRATLCTLLVVAATPLAEEQKQPQAMTELLL